MQAIYLHIRYSSTCTTLSAMAVGIAKTSETIQMTVMMILHTYFGGLALNQNKTSFTNDI